VDAQVPQARAHRECQRLAENISQIEHTRHRSGANFLVNLLAGLVANTYWPKKPSLNLRRDELSQLPVLVWPYVELTFR
jgi:hypothetical protein